uniref:Guanylate cyclase n=1 Tax=Panagrolaimus sp. PS1159 TaxID=55785 RepID=A0AC35FUX4_9BILA
MLLLAVLILTEIESKSSLFPYIRKEYSPKFPINIVVGLPTTEGSPLRNPFRLTITKSQPVFDVAIDDIYYRKLLPYGALEISYEDTQLSDAIGPQKIVDKYCNHSVDAVMGMAYVFALAPVARMSQFWGNGVPVFTTSAMVDELGDKTNFPLLTRLMGTYRTLAKMVLKIVQQLEWQRFHFFFNDQAVHGNSQGRSECYFSLNAIKNVFNHEKNIVWTVEMFSEQTATRDKFTVLLKKASLLTNMIILCASPDTVREIMLSAHDLGMATSGEYVFINIDVSTGSHAEKPWIRANDTNSPENEKAKIAYKALKTISLRRSDLEEYKNFESRVKERAENKYSYSAKTGKEYEMNNFISAFYDAVLLYAIALNETLAEGLDPRNGRNITSKMWNRTFVGITGNVSIDQNGDRYSDYSLLDLDDGQDKFMEVAYYSGAQNALRQVSDFHWVKGSPPKDSPICGWDHSKCPEGYPFYYYALFAALIVILLLLAGVLLFYRRYKLESELAAMSWKIRWEELEGDDVARKEKKKKRARKTDFYNHPDQSVPFLRSNSRTSNNSDKFGEDEIDIIATRMRLRSSSSGATRKISAMIDRKFSIFTRKKSSPTGEKAIENNHNYDDRNNISSPSNSNSNSKKKSNAEDEFENTAKKSLSMKNRKLSFYSIRSGGSVETIQMQNNAQIFTTTSTYRGQMVAIKKLNIDPKKYPKLELSRKLLMQFKIMKDLQHDHITRFAGACVDAPNYCIVTEYCPKGSLDDILNNDTIKLDKMMKYSLLHDLVKGMYFLHNSEIRSHGKLKTSNCVVDSRFVLKVTDFGLAELHAMEDTTEDVDTHSFYRKKIWTAPELLRLEEAAPPQGTQKGDVYSFALILHEMLYRKDAWYFGEGIETPDPKDILENVKKPPISDEFLYRPVIPEASPVEDHPETVKKLIDLMINCWAENPHDRPEFSVIRKIVHSLNKDNETSNLVDNLLKRMEQYATNLEGLVEERTQEYLAEKKKVEDLLHQLLPPSVADQLITGHAVQAESHDCVTIYFSDIVGFTALSSKSTPMQVVTLLNDLYLAFDGVVDNFKVYKVETIGDAYMVVSGLPDRRDDHASQIAQMSLALLHKVKNFVIRHRPNEQLKLRIGMHSGSVVSGVVGSKMPRYCLFGDTVNTSSRMESNGLPLRIHVSSDTKEILSKDPDFGLELRGQIEMKGKGLQTTYWLKSYKDIVVPDFGPEFR